MNNYGYQPFNGYPQYPYGYQAQMQRQGQITMQQQPMPTMQQPMQYETPIQDIRFVTSEEAKAFIVMPNSKALLIDKNGGVAHLKTADNMGQSVTQYFKFEQVNADGTPIKPQENATQVDYGQFVTKKELADLVTVEQYNDLFDKFNSMAEQFISIKKHIMGGKPNGTGTSNTTKQGT